MMQMDAARMQERRESKAFRPQIQWEKYDIRIQKLKSRWARG